MNTDTKMTSEMNVPTIFRKTFNQFQPIDSNQAWSLFFTAGRQDKQMRSGRIFTLSLILITGLLILGTNH